MARLFSIACILTAAGLLASPTETAQAQNASSTVLGSCNIIQQNLNVASGSTIINQVDCTPQRPEDSFSLRYVWLDETTSSLMAAGQFDPSLKPLVGSLQTVMQNQVYRSVRDITQRFGTSIANGNGLGAPKEGRSDYSIMGPKGAVPVPSQLEGSSLHNKQVKIYDGGESVVLPDIPAINTILKSDGWPQNYKMSYYNRAFRISDFMNGRLSGQDAERAAFQCTLLFRYVGQQELSNYFQNLRELNQLVAKTSLKGKAPPGQSGAAAPPELRNRAVDAMLYFGTETWPEDFLVSVSDILPGTNNSCPDPYNIQFTMVPRKLFTLIVVIEAVKDNLEIQGTTFLTDGQQGLHKLQQAGRTEAGPSGSVSLKKGETLIVPLRIELRYNLEEPPLDLVSKGSADAGRLYSRIMQLPSEDLRFQGYDWPDDNPEHAKTRTVFAKRKTAFRKPETSSVTQTYVFGPAYELKDLTVKGQTIQTRRAPANAVAFLGETGIGSCPYLFIDDQDGGYVKFGRVLVGAHSKDETRTEGIALPDGTQFIFISEQEPELTHLERVAVQVGSEGPEHILAENITVGPGQVIQLDIPESYRTSGKLVLRGYYDPLHVMVGLPQQ